MPPLDAQPRPITSLQNPTLKLIRALDMRKERREHGLFVAEGAKVVATARDAGWIPRTLVVETGSAGSGIVGTLAAWALRAGADCLEVPDAVLSRLTARDNPQKIMGVFEQRWATPPAPNQLQDRDLWVLLEEVRDPGNLGTILRTVDAVGASGVILAGSCCDPYSREATRATMGSIFSVPLAAVSLDEAESVARHWPGPVVGTHLGASADYRSPLPPGPVLLVMGSEGPGLSARLAAACHPLVRIPMQGRADSLNLAIASALLLYELRRAVL